MALFRAILAGNGPTLVDQLVHLRRLGAALCMGFGSGGLEAKQLELSLQHICKMCPLNCVEAARGRNNPKVDDMKKLLRREEVLASIA